jgi:hypothetical protein
MKVSRKAIEADPASERHGANYSVTVKATEEEVICRVARPKGTGRALYDTLQLTWAEADALLACLMDEIG